MRGGIKPEIGAEKARLHRRKMVAPIVISALVILYYAAYFGVLIVVVPGVWKVLLGVLPLGFMAVMGKTCVERIREIKKGEEDDLSHY